jgi:hypothetical protein
MLARHAPALLHRPLEHVPPLQSELVLQWPHVLLEHVPTLQSEFELQWPQLPLEHVPLPLQSEFVLQPPHVPFEHPPVLQSEFVLQWLHVPLEQLPWPLQSELVLQWPHEPLEQLPKPPQSEFVLQYGSATGASRTAAGESAVITISWSAAMTGVAIVWRCEGWSPAPHAANRTRSARCFMRRSYHRHDLRRREHAVLCHRSMT